MRSDIQPKFSWFKNLKKKVQLKKNYQWDFVLNCSNWPGVRNNSSKASIFKVKMNFVEAGCRATLIQNLIGICFCMRYRIRQK